MPLECSTWPLLCGCDTELAQKSLKSLTVNWVPLFVIILLGMPNLYMISLMNSTALATVIEATGFTSIHFVNFSTATKICVNPPLAFLNGPTKSSPHVEKGQVIGMVCSFWRAKNWQPSHWWTKESTSDMAVGQKNPCLYVFPTSDLAPMWLP
jgi:hypothetical protein